LATGHRLEPMGELTALDIGGGEGGKGVLEGMGWVDQSEASSVIILQDKDVDCKW